jgi:hypothetical protein
MSALESSTLHECCNVFNSSIDEYSVFVETGTWNGDTAFMASKFFKTIYTIEILKSVYENAINKFANTNVFPLLGDSIDILPTLLPTLTSNTIFWLDGHNSGPNTGCGKFNFPLIQECTYIDKLLPSVKSIILIDDVRLFGTKEQYQTDNTLENLTIDKILQTFKHKKIIKWDLFSSNLSSKDRLGILIH